MIQLRILFHGDIVAAAPWVGIARKFSKRTYADGIRNKTYRIGPEVAISIENYFGLNLSKVFIKVNPHNEFLSLVWQPEGILLTPRSDGVPYGFGFPKRDRITGSLINPPFGTLNTSLTDGILAQVLLNRFPNNKYLDQSEFIAGEFGKIKLPEHNPRLRANIADESGKGQRFFIYHALFYKPATPGESFWTTPDNILNWPDSPGVNIWRHSLKSVPKKWPDRDENGSFLGSLPLRQFSTDGLPLIYEEETDEWFCHWPEELLYDIPAYESVFNRSNFYRIEAGRQPVFREIRGYANLSRMVLAECQRAKDFSHESQSFRPGYQTLINRQRNAATNATDLGENLAIGQYAGGGATTGIAVVDSWRNSSLHYANIISESWDTATSLEVFGGPTGSMSTREGEILNDPLSGTLYAQVFSKRDYWLVCGTCFLPSNLGNISIDTFMSPIGNLYTTNPGFIYYCGRGIFVKPVGDKIELGIPAVILGAAVFLNSDNRHYFRVLYVYYTNNKYHITVLTRPIHGGQVNWQIECENSDILDNVKDFVSTVQFDPSGAKGVFSVVRADYTTTAFFYFPVSLSFPLVHPMDLITIQYTEGEFSIISEGKGPPLTFSVESAIESGSPDMTYLTRYRQEGNGEVSCYPYFNEDGEIVYLTHRLSLEIDQTRTGYTDPTYTANYLIHEELELVSGQIIPICHIDVDNGNFLSESYFVVILYLNPKTEDIVYARINLEKSGNQVGGTLQIIVNNEIIKSLPYRVLSTLNHLLVPNFRAEWAGNPTTDTRAIDVLDNMVIRTRDTNGYWHPVPCISGSGPFSYWYCPNNPSIEYYTGKLIVGNYRASIGRRVGNYATCYAGVRDTIPYFAASYIMGLPLLAGGNDQVFCRVARYKDRLIVQIDFTSLWGFATSDKETWIYSNFDLESLVGIGELTNLLPMGSI